MCVYDHSLDHLAGTGLLLAPVVQVQTEGDDGRVTGGGAFSGAGGLRVPGHMLSSRVNGRTTYTKETPKGREHFIHPEGANTDLHVSC